MTTLRALFVLTSLSAAGCVTVRPVAAPVNFVPQQRPEVVWVTPTSGEVVPLARPIVRGDSLTGHRLGTAEPVSFSLHQIRVMHAAQPHRGRTAALVAGIGLLAGFVVWRATQSGDGPTNCVYVPGPGWSC